MLTRLMRAVLAATLAAMISAPAARATAGPPAGERTTMAATDARARYEAHLASGTLSQLEAKEAEALAVGGFSFYFAESTDGPVSPALLGPEGFVDLKGGDGWNRLFRACGEASVAAPRVLFLMELAEGSAEAPDWAQRVAARPGLAEHWHPPQLEIEADGGAHFSMWTEAPSTGTVMRLRIDAPAAGAPALRFESPDSLVPPPEILPLVEAMASPDGAVRLAAVKELASRRDDFSVGALESALSDRSEAIRAEAALRLGRKGLARSVEPVAARLQVEPVEAVRVGLVEALQNLLDAGAVAARAALLRASTEDESAEVRELAGDGLD